MLFSNEELGSSTTGMKDVDGRAGGARAIFTLLPEKSGEIVGENAAGYDVGVVILGPAKHTTDLDEEKKRA